MSELWLAELHGGTALAASDLDCMALELHQAQGSNCSLTALAASIGVRCQGRTDTPWSDSPITSLLKARSTCFMFYLACISLVDLVAHAPVHALLASNVQTCVVCSHM